MKPPVANEITGKLLSDSNCQYLGMLTCTISPPLLPPRLPHFSWLYSLVWLTNLTGSGTHPASYPVGTGDSFRGGEAAGAWS